MSFPPVEKEVIVPLLSIESSKALMYDEEKYARPSSIRKTLQEGPLFLPPQSPFPVSGRVCCAR